MPSDYYIEAFAVLAIMIDGPDIDSRQSCSQNVNRLRRPGGRSLVPIDIEGEFGTNDGRK